ncbi:MAG: hypothetical protein NWE99_09445 [Candidatus Bathyarchaeota archaeon]|nr:hypothetical protein [Candidatus Bathyarchaeota archaeon]
MYRTIIIDCQTKKPNFSCEDCIAYKTCKIHDKTVQAKKTAKNAKLQLLIDDGVVSAKHAAKRST